MKEPHENSEESDLKDISNTVYDIISTIRDPEKDNSLEELDVVHEDFIQVNKFTCEKYYIKISFTPTVPHCSLATLIGLCIRVKLQQSLPFQFKLDIVLTEGSHDTELEVNKQINDKERVAAALENPNLLKLVTDCITEKDY